ncbi:sugar phosphate isomerase/epimerase [Pseudomonas sp. BCA14]|uniref:TIM barrel protein n=1 Tax=unclassified Pseudomonas TaxID=196821 RepID=UPI00106E9A2A|nr:MULTISPECIES: TIM barrel protein [unclassified Pseudomonas]TFF13967.1 sugar phosphate isomerase/epimerase [Pseudomonas sp. JMN1]TFF15350.1 sugar phosphate isomerase/epimerase [Pseudomonas sp. BCA17]TFF31757.1 sugar phosphate isomerase/epimerase [Pseudomonas sp. BCA14]TFF32709.1 sugar phosphate isomerase/epimerase [Pseudomonas sp. BCA13]
MHDELTNPAVLFCNGLAQQKYQGAETGLHAADEDGCTHWYIDGSLYGEMVEDWTEARIASLQAQMTVTGVTPLYRSNFKAPLGSEVEAFRGAAVEYVKKEIDIASRLGAPLIIHGGCLVEPDRLQMAKQIALERYLKSVQELARYAEGKGTDIYLESLAHYANYRIFTDQAQYALVAERVQAQRNVYFVLGVGYPNIDSGLLAHVLRRYHPLIKGISFGPHDGYADVVQAMGETRWRGLVTLEAHHRSPHQALADLAAMYLESF